MSKESNSSRSTTDKRVVKTKRILRDSLLVLLEKKPVKQITITELTELADVNRSTFYFYYDDIYDMVEQVWNDIYDNMLLTLINGAGEFTRTGDYSSFIIGFLNFCKSNQQLSYTLIKSETGRAYMDKLIADIRKVIPDSARVYNNTTSQYYLTTFALNAIVGTIFQWIRDGMKVPSHEMAMFLSETYFLGAKHRKSVL